VRGWYRFFSFFLESQGDCDGFAPEESCNCYEPCGTALAMCKPFSTLLSALAGSKGHCYCTVIWKDVREFRNRQEGKFMAKCIFSLAILWLPRLFLSSLRSTNHAFPGLIMLGEKDGNDGRKFDSPWCCTPILTHSPAPKLAKGEVTSFPRLSGSARGHGSSVVWPLDDLFWKLDAHPGLRAGRHVFPNLQRC